jgi:hypothetical protein
MLVLGSIYIPVATVVVTALIGTGTIYLNNRRLNEEGRRHRLDLDHSRELADLADLRALLDDAARVLDLAKNIRFEAEEDFNERGRPPGDEVAESMSSRIEAMISLHSRLLVRLGFSDPLVQHFGDATLSMQSTSSAFGSFGPDDRASRESVRRSIEVAARSFKKSARAFLEAAVDRTGTVPMRSPE